MAAVLVPNASHANSKHEDNWNLYINASMRTWSQKHDSTRLHIGMARAGGVTPR